MNKLDRPTKDPIALLDELEKVLGIGAYPMNWPLGTGFEFRGVYDRLAGQVHSSSSSPEGHTARQWPSPRWRLRRPRAAVGGDHRRLLEEVEMLDTAGMSFDPAAVKSGLLTPVFFGSARNNFGVQLLLDGFLAHAEPPLPRKSKGTIVPVDSAAFSGFIFKIQANMDPAIATVWHSSGSARESSHGT